MSPNNQDNHDDRAVAPSTVSTKFPTFIRIGRGLKRLGKGLVVLIVIGMLAHGITSVIQGRKLESDLQAIKAKGEPIALANLASSGVPDSENAALVYAKASLRLGRKELDPARGDLLNVLDPAERRDNPRLWADASKALAQVEDVIPLIEEAASKPRCQVQVNWKDGINAVYTPQMFLRDVGRMLGARAMVQAHNGDIAGACHSIELGLKVSEAQGTMPTLIEQLVRMGTIRISTAALRDTLDKGGMTETQARSLYDLLSTIDLTPGYVKVMQTERVFGIWVFDYIRRHPEELPSLMSGPESPAPKNALLKPLVFLWKPLSYMDERFYLRHMNAVVANAAMPYREVMSQRLEVDREPQFRRYYVISNVITPFISRARARRDSTAGEIAGTRTALALTAYKGRFGTYPTSLAELRSKLGWEIPMDPFSGKDFIYKREGSGFLLYSIGSNLKDDGARPYVEHTSAGGTIYIDNRGGKFLDIIWRISL